VVTTSGSALYVDEAKLTEEVKTHLGQVQIKPYTSIFQDLKTLSQSNKKVWIDPSHSSLALFNCFDDHKLILSKVSPITPAKAIKNEAELEGFRQCHIRDGVALVSFFSWLEERLIAGDDTLTEASLADKVDEFRGKQADFVSLSFDTISGSGANGAIIHYKPQHGKCAKVTIDKMYLCDSGGQYRDGTTDVTRTFHFGNPTQHEKNCFTRVLQGVIGLDTAVFPKGTTGRELDILARINLWKVGLDYRHGTGHGVGAFLCVHEGPQGVSFRDPPYKIPMEPGMTITDEPGYYEDGNFGIRIENVLLCKEVNTEFNFGDKGYLGFECITLCPIQTKLMEKSIMTKNEIDWVNNYHKRVFDTLSKFVSGSTLEWLKKETQPI